jgi:hypothetical protein
VAGAGSGPVEVEKDIAEHRYSLVPQAQKVGLLARRYHVDQPRTQTEGQGNSGDGLHHKQAQVDLGWWEGGSWPTTNSQQRCRLPPPQRPARSARPVRGAYIRQDKTRQGPGGHVQEMGGAMWRGYGRHWHCLEQQTERTKPLRPPRLLPN